jgi:hypothetical protein
VISLVFEAFIQFTRQSLILNSLTEADDCPYILTLDDLELL